MYRFFHEARPAGLDALLLSLASFVAAHGPPRNPERWRQLLAVCAALLDAYYERREEVIEPPALIDGHELISSLGLAPGPGVGGLLENIREAQAAGEVQSRGEALDLAQRLLEKGGPL